jgi:head-tail adaptor
MKLKDKKIEILQPVTSKDAEGFGAETLVPIAPPLWAYFRQLSGKEIYAGGATHATEQVMFVINWREGLSTALLVRYKGVFMILRELICLRAIRAILRCIVT